MKPKALIAFVGHSRAHAARVSLIAAIAGCFLILAVAPSSAPAAGGPALAWTLSVPLSHGYHLRVAPAPGYSGPAVLLVTVLKGSPATGQIAVSYTPRRASWGAQWMSIDLGQRGRIDLRFQPSGRTAPLPPLEGCGGRSGRQLLGVWRGSVQFTGEHRFTAASASTVRGAVTLAQPTYDRPICPFDREWPYPRHGGAKMDLLMPLPGGPAAWIRARLVSGVSTVEFVAQSAPPPRDSGRGMCAVARIAPARDLRVSGDVNWTKQIPPRRVTADPPWPFRGTATFTMTTNSSNPTQPSSLNDNSGLLTTNIQLYCPNLGYLPASSARLTRTARWVPDTLPG